MSKNKLNDNKDRREAVVEKIKKTNWHSDWSGPFSLFGISLPTNTYFEGMEINFGKGLNEVFIVYKNGIAFSRLQEDQYHQLGVHLVNRAKDIAFVRKWSDTFKESADKVRKEISISVEEYIKNLPELLKHYQLYGAHNVATKIAFDIGHDKLSNEAKNLLEDARLYSETFYKDDALMIESVLRYLSEETGYPYDEMFMLTYDELNSYLKAGMMPPHEELRARHVSSGIYCTKDEMTVLFTKDMEDVERSRVGNSNNTEIAGRIAYKGVVRGRCRIVLEYKNSKFENGEILVTGMTDPHFTDLMKKAAAIVTDGGGMLSHAAIVARELRIPCVIATKIATQVLRDNDFVEVDADTGVVRILERK